jgi:hypothetical protein
MRRLNDVVLERLVLKNKDELEFCFPAVCKFLKIKCKTIPPVETIFRAKPENLRRRAD